ncbi:MAG: ABC transporter substrate-binding protein [Microthrixaceae bacterium]|nr:ABC transporter substrate-binding protein [Microthrixaceae bacterium]
MKLRRLLVVVAALALVAGACSSRGEDASGSSDDTSDTTAATSDAGAGGETFGDMESPCGDGEPTAPEGGPDETQGVSADAIAVGTVADPGFTGRPGLNQEIFDAGEAFVAWCNEQGGINGRELQLTQYDAAISNYQPELTAACDQEFAMVGGGAVQDNLWETTGLECGLIDVTGFSVTPEKAGESGPDEVRDTRTVQPVPNPSDQFPVGALKMVAEDFPDALDNVGILYADLATLQVQAARTKEAYEQNDATIVYEQTYNVLGEANWAPFANAIKEAGVTWLNFVGEGENLAALQQAMSEIDYSPEVTLQDTNFYDQAYLDAAGPAANGTYLRSAFVPFEEAADNPATQQYIDLVEAEGGKVALLGAQSMSGWLLFSQAVKECDDQGTLTRSCVLETAGSVTDWTGGGLHAPTDPSTNSGPTCQMVLLVEDEAFTRYAPDEGFQCEDDYVAELEGDYSASG